MERNNITTATTTTKAAIAAAETEATIKDLADKMDKIPALALIQGVSKVVPIVPIVSRYVKLKRDGSGVYCGLCPFHQDEHADSFNVYASPRNRFVCFVCDERGDVVDFVARTEGISNVQAAKHILRMLTGDAEAMSKVVEARKPKRIKDNVKREPEYLAAVYGCFVRAADDLTPEHIEMIRSWGLPEYADQEREHFFEWPHESTDFWRRFWNGLRAAGVLTGGQNLRDVLRCVPGFWEDVNQRKPCWSQYTGIGFVERDANGMITALQVRPDVKCGSKYKLFSSGFAERDDPDEQCIGGATIGQVTDLVLVDDPRAWIVTEGHKKALVLAREKHVSVLSVNGVNSMDPVVEFTGLAREAGADTIHICYDMDAYTKKPVAAAALALADRIATCGLECRFLTWDPEDGKGADDYLLNPSPSSQMKSVSRKTYEALIVEHLGADVIQKMRCL